VIPPSGFHPRPLLGIKRIQGGVQCIALALDAERPKPSPSPIFVGWRAVSSVRPIAYLSHVKKRFISNIEKMAHCSGSNNGVKTVTLWRETDFSRAKESIASGEGLGRGFLQHFLPSGVQYTPATLQNAIDSYYAESRKAAAKLQPVSHNVTG
jgi:hypothetical protein